MENITQQKSQLFKVGLVLGILLCAYVGAKIITEVRSYKYIGGGISASNVISFEGRGEVSAAPDMATVSFTLRDTQSDMKRAEENVTQKETRVLEFLTTSGIEEKDIKTENYSSYPKYDYGTPCYQTLNIGSYVPCRSEPKLIGYEVSESITVKIRDLAKTGDIVKGLTDLAVTEISGPNFSIENEDEVKAQARKMAIDEAKKKAEVLADDLGVRLVRIVNFSENGNYPMPYYAKAEMATDAVVSQAAPAPALPTGENKIISNVTITYEIR